MFRNKFKGPQFPEWWFIKHEDCPVSTLPDHIYLSPFGLDHVVFWMCSVFAYPRAAFEKRAPFRVLTLADLRAKPQERDFRFPRRSHKPNWIQIQSSSKLGSECLEQNKAWTKRWDQLWSKSDGDSWPEQPPRNWSLIGFGRKQGLRLADVHCNFIFMVSHDIKSVLTAKWLFVLPVKLNYWPCGPQSPKHRLASSGTRVFCLFPPRDQVEKRSLIDEIHVSAWRDSKER